MSFFDEIPKMPIDPIFGLPIAFNADSRPNKVNLGIGAYRTEEGNPYVLKSVEKAETIILKKHLDKEYLPIDGDRLFLEHSLKLLLGEGCNLENLVAAQSVGGTGSLRIAGDLLSKLISRTIFISEPTWANHKQIFEKAQLNVIPYPYYDSASSTLNFSSLCDEIRRMHPGSAILLHGCCHNPTGVDPSTEQWRELSHLIKKQKIIPLFDFAYQGFGDGIEQDAAAIRYFVKEGHECLISYSFSKNFGLYGERVGFLAVICPHAGQKEKIGSQIRTLIRGNYSNPPLHGARIISTILQSSELKNEWIEELQEMRERIKKMRHALSHTLHELGNRRNFDYLVKLKGLFSFSGLNESQVDRLKQEYAIYMPNDGRINIAGLNSKNLSYVAKSFLSVMYG